jgi:hypothetical protein
MTYQGHRKDHEDHGYRSKQPSNQKEKMPFLRSNDADKWCEIHRTTGHDREEYKTFLDQKKMSSPVAMAPQEARQGEHHRANPLDDDE